MELLFNSLLDQMGIAPGSVRLLRHQDSRSDKGRTPYELWRDDRPAFEEYQSTQSPSNRTKLSAEFWISFVVNHAGETLLAGLYQSRCLGLNESVMHWPHASGFSPVGTCDVYELRLDDRLNDLAGRLLIEWGHGERSWIQRADNQNKIVSEIRAAFAEPEFPGYSNFVTSLSKIENLPAGWIAALKASRGVYLLTCPATKEQYVGAAVGDGGFHSRWLDYVGDGHGGNVALKSRDPSDYQVSILEVAGSMAAVEDILAMEVLWKLKLQSREMGLNRN
ncbi:hypothetical protein A7A08_01600 [Methyloligella halotolerans]|uniref:GIY-YIG domain-containing protein n=1 Tax=Methyloligella halotolerans TaxID=1177755 RepID=A0A1E2RZA1_9HYPH|nr:GIY-YIG nuclease family protein [Methyloligella halotolerans]ODA67566.1 hypothetical protein A7A08_01600 [Methyloligella halotolerans]